MTAVKSRCCDINSIETYLREIAEEWRKVGAGSAESLHIPPCLRCLVVTWCLIALWEEVHGWRAHPGYTERCSRRLVIEAWVEGGWRGRPTHL